MGLGTLYTLRWIGKNNDGCIYADRDTALQVLVLLMAAERAEIIRPLTWASLIDMDGQHVKDPDISEILARHDKKGEKKGGDNG